MNYIPEVFEILEHAADYHLLGQNDAIERMNKVELRMVNRLLDEASVRGYAREHAFKQLYETPSRSELLLGEKRWTIVKMQVTLLLSRLEPLLRIHPCAVYKECFGDTCFACASKASKRCMRCKAFMYCTEECYAREWSNHRQQCGSYEARGEVMRRVAEALADVRESTVDRIHELYKEFSAREVRPRKSAKTVKLFLKQKLPKCAQENLICLNARD